MVNKNIQTDEDDFETNDESNHSSILDNAGDVQDEGMNAITDQVINQFR